MAVGVPDEDPAQPRYFFVNGDAGDYSLGMLDDDWGRAFVAEVKKAITVAVISGR
ncbi:hypothetical protein [Asanoa siamensis]|uniref:Uncharacterized protein n=1 Tax=Asanoa siamensis TaxID=926357 RepID=A0ABQ4CVA8_9ACTN|nr:hypothetical protein [Asanoa siamensis]GIF75227.1 hypothetical protein Asi02nite_47450 [Asanoa siamensis]